MIFGKYVCGNFAKASLVDTREIVFDNFEYCGMCKCVIHHNVFVAHLIAMHGVYIFSHGYALDDT